MELFLLTIIQKNKALVSLENIKIIKHTPLKNKYNHILPILQLDIHSPNIVPNLHLLKSSYLIHIKKQDAQVLTIKTYKKTLLIPYHSIKTPSNKLTLSYKELIHPQIKFHPIVKIKFLTFLPHPFLNLWIKKVKPSRFLAAKIQWKKTCKIKQESLWIKSITFTKKKSIKNYKKLI